ncbi:hypothetical protein KAR91_21180 [Candidatus Pacearchaeota archaeon]|nr:hypothetical protein [Candidatus Pacearchaeota archaeon]
MNTKGMTLTTLQSMIGEKIWLMDSSEVYCRRIDRIILKHGGEITFSTDSDRHFVQAGDAHLTKESAIACFNDRLESKKIKKDTDAQSST